MWSTPSTSSTRWSSIASLRCLTGARNRRRRECQAFFSGRDLAGSVALGDSTALASLRPSSAVATSQARSRLVTRRPSLRSGLLRLPEDLRDLVDLGEQLVGLAGVELTLGAGGTGQLGGLVDQGVQLGVLLEVRGLEVVGP